MRVSAHKSCNICGDRVATKHQLRYHTDKFYVTLRSDDYHYEDATVKGEVHICKDCWKHLQEYIRGKVKKHDN